MADQKEVVVDKSQVKLDLYETSYLFEVVVSSTWIIKLLCLFCNLFYDEATVGKRWLAAGLLAECVSSEANSGSSKSHKPRENAVFSPLICTTF